MRTGLIIIAVVVALTTFSPTTQAETAITDEIEVTFVSGVVVGRSYGRGTATVTALVTNKGTRNLSGLRVEVYYSTVDAFPAGEASWRPHEYVLDPPLSPGKSTTLTFMDENASEYILIELRNAVFKAGLSYQGKVIVVEGPIVERDGVTYISVREIARILGAEIGFDALTKEIRFSFKGRELRFRVGEDNLRAAGQTYNLGSPVISIDDQSFVPLPGIAPALGLSYSRDSALNMIMLDSLDG